MSYEVSGFIAKRGTFDHFKKLGERISVAHLNDEFDMLLNDWHLGDALKFDTHSKVDEFENWSLHKSLIKVFVRLSRKENISIMYFDAMFWGGVGEQRALVWKNSDMILKKENQRAPIPEAFGPINEALKAIGVVAKNGKDEFQSVNLNRHRQMYGWFEEATGISAVKYHEE